MKIFIDLLLNSDWGQYIEDVGNLRYQRLSGQAFDWDMIDGARWHMTAHFAIEDKFKDEYHKMELLHVTPAFRSIAKGLSGVRNLIFRTPLPKSRLCKVKFGVKSKVVCYNGGIPVRIGYCRDGERWHFMLEVLADDNNRRNQNAVYVNAEDHPSVWTG